MRVRRQTPSFSEGVEWASLAAQGATSEDNRKHVRENCPVVPGPCCCVLPPSRHNRVCFESLMSRGT